MKNKKRLIKLNNKGASLITVMLTIAFITILVGIAIMSSLVNYRMKRVNAYAKDTFYSAEQVLDEINVGLQRYISDSISEAYIEILEHYNDYSVDKKNTLMQTKYYENMWDKLQVAGAGNSKYDTEILRAFLKTSTDWRGTEADGYGAIIRAVDSAGLLTTQGDMVTYNNGIVLKDLRVYYKDSKGFVSIIETDIRMTYPGFDFATTTALPNVASFGFIADAGVELQGVTQLTLEGNFYADSLVNTGYQFNNGVTKAVSHTGDGKIVIKNEMTLQNASLSNEDEGVLWAKDIQTISGDLDLNGETLIADDLNINGDGSRITLSGVYNGFGNSAADADASSAILVNGTNSSVNFSGVEKLTVAGHAFVGAKSDNVIDLGFEEGDLPAGYVKNDRNIYTGESIAIKGNQTMYLVPPECIGIENAYNRSVYNKNPLSAEEYQALQTMLASDPNHLQYTEVSGTVAVEKLGGRTLGEFAEHANGRVNFELVQVPTNDGSLIYYYMKFASEEAANEYFEIYYGANKEEFDEYIERYADLLSFPTGNGLATVRLAANGLNGTPANYNRIDNTVDNAATRLSDNQTMYQENFNALCTRLMDSYAQVTGSYQTDLTNQIVFDNLVDEVELQTYIEEVTGVAGANTATIDGPNGKVVLTTDEINGYKIDDADVHLVISTGNVQISTGHFTGSIIADGKVTVEGGVQDVIVDEALVNSLLRYYHEINGQNVMVAQVLRDGRDYIFAVQDQEDEEDKVETLADLIIYENWKKE